MSQNLFTRFRSQSWDDARPFIRTSDDGVVSYGDALLRSAQLANALVKLGVQRGDRIVVQVEKSATALLLYLASLRVGAVYVPLNTAYSQAELDYLLINASLQIGYTMERDSMFIGADKVLVCKIAKYFVHTLARSSHHRSKLLLRQAYIDANTIFDFDAMGVSQLQKFLGHAPVDVQKDQVFNHLIGVA